MGVTLVDRRGSLDDGCRGGGVKKMERPAMPNVSLMSHRGPPKRHYPPGDSLNRRIRSATRPNSAACSNLERRMIALGGQSVRSSLKEEKTPALRPAREVS